MNEGPFLNAAINSWFATRQGQDCLHGTAAGKYLRNRLEAAFIAGWDAHKAATAHLEKPAEGVSTSTVKVRGPAELERRAKESSGL